MRGDNSGQSFGITSDTATSQIAHSHECVYRSSLCICIIEKRGFAPLDQARQTPLFQTKTDSFYAHIRDVRCIVVGSRCLLPRPRRSDRKQQQLRLHVSRGRVNPRASESLQFTGGTRRTGTWGQRVG
ncbi:unnamed protein product [Protopolystoma xenopodis]|uniref:Uncharacterized protein n=1 Tax=Protopolystoma xenopodis TaxID=117903 RepID=A0A3S5B1S5_9PLAT|nr:unnamed protein product [Protopolystoma xenopodis]